MSASPPSSATVAAGYRKAPVTPRDQRLLGFDRLPPAVRDRLERGLSGAAPDALLAAPSGLAPFAQRVSLALAAAALVATAVLFNRGLGDLRGDLALQPATYAVAYAALLGGAALALVAFVALRRFQGGAPFRSGRYLFALDLLEVEAGRLRLTSLGTLRALEPRGGQVAAVFEDGHAVLFPMPKGERPGDVAADHWRTIRAAADLAAPADAAKLQRLDPFYEVRVSDDWASCVEQTPASPARLVLLGSAALVLAAPIGVGLVRARNAFSDDLMFDEARATPEPGYTHALATYATKGRRHVDEALPLLVESVHGDRVELRRMAARGGAMGAIADDALFESAKTDPDELSRIVRLGGKRAEEADEALYAIARRLDTASAYAAYAEAGKKHLDEVKQKLLPEAEFRQASASPQVGALCAFVRRNPGSSHEDEAWKRIREAYAGAMPAFEAAEHPPAEGARFARALLDALLERGDPRVTLDIRTAPPTAVALADKTNAAEHGDLYLPSASRFSFANLATVRDEIRGAVSDWFGKAFPRGVIEVTSPSAEDQGWPRFEVQLEPTVDGITEWGKAGADGGQRSHVTPLVGFAVQVTGTVMRDDKPVTLSWKLRLEDETQNGKMMTRDFAGRARGRGQMLDDVYAPFLDGVPARIAASFHERL